jgi:opacity protein-like surface antigen
MLKTFWILLVCAVLGCATRAAAQPLGLGIKLGSTLTNAVTSVETASVPNRHTFIVGPYLEMRLPIGFSIEADALYYPGLFSNGTGGSTGSLWQFPVLLKFGLPLGPIKPYIEGGPAYSHLSDVAKVLDVLHTSNYGITLGAGIEINIHGLRISPEVRYNGVLWSSVKSPAGLFTAKHDQAVLQVGIGF